MMAQQQQQQPCSLESDLSRLNLNIANFAPKQYSPNLGKKIAPVVPPKPKKNGPSTNYVTSPPTFLSSSTASSPYGGAANRAPSADRYNGGGMENSQSIYGQFAIARSAPYSSVGGGHQENNIPNNIIQQVDKVGGSNSGNNLHYLDSTTMGKPTVATATATTNGGDLLQTSSPGYGRYPPPPLEPSLERYGGHPVAQAPPYSSSGPDANYSNPSNYSNSSNYSNPSNYSNMANYSDSSNYSNSSNYSDMSNYGNYNSLTSYGTYTPPPPDDDLPPPPPPEPSSYSPSTTSANHSFPPPPLPEEVFPPPPPSPAPSPVSSSYSELRRANAQNYGTYGPVSSQSSTYESIYEPINPRPQSQMASYMGNYSSGSSLYAPYTSSKGKGLLGMSAPPQRGTSVAVGGGRGPPLGKEAEVDALTNLLVQSMDSSSDPDFFGMCTKCGEKVMGERNGCTAMDQIYHIDCFTCCMCQTCLQGKPFYAMDGKPYCEEDYLNTLEKCSVCTKPILDRILRATGKPYHPKCFTCIVCGKSLDGIPFTVDAANQIHCIDDFHKKFAPRCCVCKQPIMPEPGLNETVRVVALDKSFHVNCYKCEDCGLVLSSEAEGRGCYPLDDHILCKSCNAARVQALTSKMATEL